MDMILNPKPYIIPCPHEHSPLLCQAMLERRGLLPRWSIQGFL